MLWKEYNSFISFLYFHRLSVHFHFFLLLYVVLWSCKRDYLYAGIDIFVLYYFIYYHNEETLDCYTTFVLTIQNSYWLEPAHPPPPISPLFAATPQLQKKSISWILTEYAKWFPQIRSSGSQIFCKIGALKDWAIFTGKHLCWSLFFIKLQVFSPATLLKRDSNTVVFLWMLWNFYWIIFIESLFHKIPLLAASTAQKMKISIKNFFSKCDQILGFPRIWSHLLKKLSMENFIFCAVFWRNHLLYTSY